MCAARPVPAVSAMVARDGHILLVKRGCEPNKGLWSLPGGSIEHSETAEAAVKREILEETGLHIEVDGVAGIRDVISPHPDSNDYHFVIIVFHAHAVGGELRAMSDAAEAEWVSLDDMRNYALTPDLWEFCERLLPRG